jgi:ATP-dependent Clp protease ATP-binding subunit ClpX
MALRGIIETMMLEAMYEVPSSDDVKRVVIPDGVISESRQPILMTEEEVRQEKAS